MQLENVALKSKTQVVNPILFLSRLSQHQSGQNLFQLELWHGGKGVVWIAGAWDGKEIVDIRAYLWGEKKLAARNAH